MVRSLRNLRLTRCNLLLTFAHGIILGLIEDLAMTLVGLLDDFAGFVTCRLDLLFDFLVRSGQSVVTARGTPARPATTSP